MIHSTDRELLSILLGDEAQRYTMHSLAELFGLRRIRPDQTLGCDLVIQRIPSGTAGHNLTAPCL